MRPHSKRPPISFGDVELCRRARLRELSDRIMLARVATGRMPETEPGRQKEARFAVLLATTLIDEQDRFGRSAESAK